MDKDYLDNEEKELLESYESLDVDNIPLPDKDEQKKMKAAARSFIKKESKINIRIDPLELEKIKEIAAQECLKYQTFVKSVLHKYITGQLVEKQNSSI